MKNALRTSALAFKGRGNWKNDLDIIRHIGNSYLAKDIDKK